MERAPVGAAVYGNERRGYSEAVSRGWLCSGQYVFLQKLVSGKFHRCVLIARVGVCIRRSSGMATLTREIQRSKASTRSIPLVDPSVPTGYSLITLIVGTYGRVRSHSSSLGQSYSRHLWSPSKVVHGPVTGRPLSLSITSARDYEYPNQNARSYEPSSPPRIARNPTCPSRAAVLSCFGSIIKVSTVIVVAML